MLFLGATVPLDRHCHRATTANECRKFKYLCLVIVCLNTLNNMGSFLSKQINAESAKKSASKICLNAAGKPPILPESPILGLKCNHVFLKTKHNHPLCSKCGCVISSPNKTLKRINSENRRKDELKLKVKAQIAILENESSNHITMQGQENEDNSFIQYPAIEPGFIPLTSLPSCFNRESVSGYQFQKQQQQNLETITQDETYFLVNSKPKFMTIKSGRPKVSYSFGNEF